MVNERKQMRDELKAYKEQGRDIRIHLGKASNNEMKNELKIMKSQDKNDLHFNVATFGNKHVQRVKNGDIPRNKIKRKLKLIN
mmetsp:Transcript_31524/g.40534  ORF Transcript_31524/g.40534 Transcript_31524/m.40534 type:complete len:83 (-) Transcript_31524:24-272(-)